MANIGKEEWRLVANGERWEICIDDYTGIIRLVDYPGSPKLPEKGFRAEIQLDDGMSYPYDVAYLEAESLEELKEKTKLEIQNRAKMRCAEKEIDTDMEEMSFISDWADDEHNATGKGIVGHFYSSTNEGQSLICKVYDITERSKEELSELCSDYEQYTHIKPTKISISRSTVEQIDKSCVENNRIVLGKYILAIQFTDSSDISIS